MATQQFVNRLVYSGTLTREAGTNRKTGEPFDRFVQHLAFDPDKKTATGYDYLTLTREQLKFFPRANCIYQVTREMAQRNGFYTLEIVNAEYLNEWEAGGSSEPLRIAK